jgi:hypothetical protein
VKELFQKLASFTKKVADFADHVTGNPAENKAQFDAAPEELRTYFNNLIDALKSTASGDSGAKNTGATAIAGLTGTDVQSLLESLKTYVDNTNTGAIFGKGSQSFNSGFMVFPIVQWISEMDTDLFSSTAENKITFKKAGLYAVDFTCTRSDLPANQQWTIGFAINDTQSSMVTEKMVMGQYGWTQSSGPNLSLVPLHLSSMVRVKANDYINFNNNSDDGPRGYDVKFRVMRISD